MYSPLILWLPILVSAVAVFVASSVIHMMLPWHKSDYGRLPNEGAVSDALRALNIPPGEYMAPRPDSRASMGSPEFKEKMARGPVYILNIFPMDRVGMGGTMGQWFIYCLVVSAFAGHVAQGANLNGTSDWHPLTHTVGLSAFMGYSFALWQVSIWFRRPWLTTVKSTVDGLIYAAITAAIFWWLWPK